MMGQRSGNQEQLFYAFNLDDHVPKDHLLRGIDHFFDARDLRRHMASFTVIRGALRSIQS